MIAGGDFYLPPIGLLLLERMSEINSYFKITKPSEGIFKDRGSKFLGYAFPVYSEDEIKECLMQLRREHPSARHHCYAWKLDPTSDNSRANDDGEPSGSAGKPILNQIQINNLNHVLIVVVRYFGGTLLGVNGLINAYKCAAADAIANAIIEEHFVLNEYQVEFDAMEQGAVMRVLKEFGAKIISNDYNSKQEIIFQIKKQVSEALEKKFADLYKVQLKFLQTK
ncbi:MAG: YigZ family protein [Bacteroidia bacterium]|nr:YigZ family protein [Bacteroidia bacterium]